MGSAAPVRVVVTFLNGVFDAAVAEGGAAEWPPHPYRLFAALRAGAAALGTVAGPAAGDRAVQALERLEHCPAPVVWASREAARYSRSGFVPVIPDYPAGHPPRGHPPLEGWLLPVDVPNMTNVIKATGFPDISTSRGLVKSTGTAPALPAVAFDIDPVALIDGDVAALSRAAAEVPYLGRSTSPALVRFTDAATAQPGLTRYIPGDGPLVMSMWGPGLVAALEDKFESGTFMPGRVTLTSARYRPDGPTRGLWAVYEPTEHLPYRAVLSAIAAFDELGHTLNVLFVVLVNVGSRWANGRLAVAALTEAESTLGEVTAALLGRGWVRTPADRGWTSRTQWVRPSAVFATATPVIMATKSRERATAQITEWAADYGPVRSISVGRYPFLRGAEPVRAGGCWHVAVSYANQINPGIEPLRLGPSGGLLFPPRGG